MGISKYWKYRYGLLKSDSHRIYLQKEKKKYTPRVYTYLANGVNLCTVLVDGPSKENINQKYDVHIHNSGGAAGIHSSFEKHLSKRQLLVIQFTKRKGFVGNRQKKLCIQADMSHLRTPNMMEAASCLVDVWGAFCCFCLAGISNRKMEEANCNIHFIIMFAVYRPIIKENTWMLFSLHFLQVSLT